MKIPQNKLWQVVNFNGLMQVCHHVRCIKPVCFIKHQVRLGTIDIHRFAANFWIKLASSLRMKSFSNQLTSSLMTTSSRLVTIEPDPCSNRCEHTDDDTGKVTSLHQTLLKPFNVSKSSIRSTQVYFHKCTCIFSIFLCSLSGSWPCPKCTFNYTFIHNTQS